MGVLHPRDPRWQGSARSYMYLDLIKNTILSGFIVIVIIEGALYRHWYMDYHDTVEFDSGGAACVPSPSHHKTHFSRSAARFPISMP